MPVTRKSSPKKVKRTKLPGNTLGNLGAKEERTRRLLERDRAISE